MCTKTISLLNLPKICFFVVKQRNKKIDTIGFFSKKKKIFYINKKKLKVYLQENFVCSKSFFDIAKKFLIKI